MNSSLLSALIYLLGFIGLASIGLLLLRSWQILRCLKGGTSKISGKLPDLIKMLVIAAALSADVQITTRVFRCLTQTYCGPNIASGWTYLAMLGVIYLAFEAIIFALRQLGRIRAIKLN